MSPSPPARWAFLPTLGTQEGEAESPLQVSGVWRPLTKPWPRLQNWPPERMSPTTPTRRLPSLPPCPSCAVAEWIKCMGMTPPVIGSSLHLGTTTVGRRILTRASTTSSLGRTGSGRAHRRRQCRGECCQPGVQWLERRRSGQNGERSQL